MQSTKQTHNKPLVRHTWAALLLLWVMLYNIVPLQLFHVHNHAETHCEVAEACQNTNPCHISLHHAHSGQEACSHTAHITTPQDDCGFCNYLSSHRQLHFISTPKKTAGIYNQQYLLYKNVIAPRLLVFSLSQANKGPPLV